MSCPDNGAIAPGFRSAPGFQKVMHGLGNRIGILKFHFAEKLEHPGGLGWGAYSPAVAATPSGALVPWRWLLPPRFPTLGQSQFTGRPAFSEPNGFPPYSEHFAPPRHRPSTKNHPDVCLVQA